MSGPIFDWLRMSQAVRELVVRWHCVHREGGDQKPRDPMSSVTDSCSMRHNRPFDTDAKMLPCAACARLLVAGQLRR